MNYELEYYQLKEEKNMKNSNLWKLNWKDFLNGLIFAIIGNVIFYLLAIFANLYQLVMKGETFSITLNWNAVLVVAVFSALTYLSKRFVSNENGTVLGN